MWTEAIPGWSISWFSGHGPRCGRKRSQDGRFHDFLGMAPDVDGSDPRMVDFMIFWAWPQMSTEAIPGWSISWLSGYGSRCRRNRSPASPPRQPTQPQILDLISDPILNPMWNPVLDPILNPILNPSNIESNDESNIESNIGKRFLKAYVQDFTSRKIMTGDLYHLHFLLFN